MMDGYGMDGGFGFGGGFMFLWWIVIIVVVVMVIKWLASSYGSVGNSRRENRAMEILEERYARGEIDEQEFQKRKRELRP
ncbi:MAG: SHOCT domain-containing protein [Pseudomonadota bacterium]